MRLLIIAKTYPELSSKYGETVCTAAVDGQGKPLRLYPIPFRYLAGPQRFERYQWIDVDVAKSKNDPRPESYTVTAETIALGSKEPPTPDEWGKRAQIVLSSPAWQYTSMHKLLDAQRENGQSLAFVSPMLIRGVSVRRRETDDAQSFQEKLDELKKQNAAARLQLVLFERSVPPAMKTLQYIGERVCVDWLCWDSDCQGHSMQILDWEICELARKEGIAAAKKKVETLLDLSHYNTSFILGNFHMYPGSFAIIGLWYPLRSNRLF